MWMLLFGVICVFLASSRSEPLQVNFRGCSVAGVFLAEGAHRHSLNVYMARRVCEQLDATLASQEQVKEAYTKGMQTCRKGWMIGNFPAMLRQTRRKNCAGNKIGYLTFPIPMTKNLYDAFCFDDKVGPERNCLKSFRKSNAGVSKLTTASPPAKPQLPKMPGPGERFDAVQYQETLPCCRKMSNSFFQDIIWYWQWKICLFRQQMVTKCRLEIEKY